MVLFRFLARIALILYYIAGLGPLYLLHPRTRHGLILGFQTRLARLFLRTYGIRVTDPPVSTAGHLVVANHTSLLDAFALLAIAGSRFITSVEMEQTPGVGAFTRASQCLFTERRKHLRTPASVSRELELVVDALRQGDSIGLFPEGTTTDGSVILPFKGFYFEAARKAQAPVQTVYLRWQGVAQTQAPVFPKEMSLGKHVADILFARELRLEIEWLGEVSSVGVESGRELCRLAEARFEGRRERLKRESSAIE